jgi:hypothetical protein
MYREPACHQRRGEELRQHVRRQPARRAAQGLRRLLGLRGPVGVGATDAGAA